MNLDLKWIAGVRRGGETRREDLFSPERGFGFLDSR